MNAYEKFKRLSLDPALISLARGSISVPYFCYPLNAEAIGFEGCILYCFIRGYGDMVFAANPETCADAHVYPLARSFEDFLRLILACGSANPVEQIAWTDRSRFEQHLQDEAAIRTDAQRAALEMIAAGLELAPMEDPFGYVKSLQAGFDGSRIEYSDEYYDVLGIERP